MVVAGTGRCGLGGWGVGEKRGGGGGGGGGCLQKVTVGTRVWCADWWVWLIVCTQVEVIKVSGVVLERRMKERQIPLCCFTSPPLSVCPLNTHTGIHTQPYTCKHA